MELVPLVCLCLLTWSGPTSADEGGPSVVTVAVAEGRDAILPCSLRTKENIEQTVFDWKKDGQEVFLYDAGKHYNKGRTGQDQQFRGRVFHFEGELKYGNASIKVHNTKMADDGGYTCTFPGKQVSHIRLVVGAAQEPSVTNLNQTKDWAQLQCVVRGAFPKPEVEWQDSGGNILPAQEPQVTDKGRSYDITLRTTVTKTDRYRCVATQEEISHQIHAEIYVLMNGAAPEAYVTSLKETKDWALLQCVVRGASPKPLVQWQDSDRNILPAEEQVSEREGSYDIILQTTVTKTDHYYCVSTQEEISHQTKTGTHVYVSEFPTGWVVVAAVLAAVFVGVCVIVVLVVLVKMGCMTLNSKKGRPSDTCASP